jgi:hypothetical protein
MRDIPNDGDDDDDHHYHHVDEVRLRLWTAATSGPIIPPPGDIWVWRTVVKWYRQGKTPDSSTRALWKSCQHSHLVEKQEELANEIMNLALRSVFFILRRVLWHAVKCCDMGLTTLRSLRRKACCGILSPLKMHLPWLGLIPRTLGPVSNTLTITPPKRLPVMLPFTN